jgi:hypothetical protein
MLTQAELKKYLRYYPDSGIFTCPCPARWDKLLGTPNKLGYVYIMVRGRMYAAHRLAWLYVHGEFPKDEIDHINRIRGDNRICNLREATHKENCRNRDNRPNKIRMLDKGDIHAPPI